MPQPPFDLDAYLDRLGLDAPPPADLDGLATVQAAQLRAVPFENLDVVLGVGVDVEPTAVFEKLVTRRRGGYCFECNTLLRDALMALGFDARLLLGRVIMNLEDGSVPPRTHAVVEVQVDGDAYIADCGFGAQTPRAPLRLEDGADCGDTPASAGGWRVSADTEFGWRLARTEPGGPPRDLYVFDQARVYPFDVALGNHWTSTHPTTSFTQRLIAVRHTDRGRIVLSGRRLAEHVGESVDERTIEAADELMAVIQDRLEIPLEIGDAGRRRIWDVSAAVRG